MIRRELRSQMNGSMCLGLDVFCKRVPTFTIDFDRGDVKWTMRSPPESCPRDDGVDAGESARRLRGRWSRGPGGCAPPAAPSAPWAARPAPLSTAHHPRPAAPPPSHTSAQENFTIGTYLLLMTTSWRMTWKWPSRELLLVFQINLDTSICVLYC